MEHQLPSPVPLSLPLPSDICSLLGNTALSADSKSSHFRSTEGSRFSLPLQHPVYSSHCSGALLPPQWWALEPCGARNSTKADTQGTHGAGGRGPRVGEPMHWHSPQLPPARTERQSSIRSREATWPSQLTFAGRMMGEKLQAAKGFSFTEGSKRKAGKNTGETPPQVGT